MITNRPSGVSGIIEHDASFDREASETRLDLYLRMTRKAIEIRRTIRSIKPDILHLHTLYYPAYLGVLSGFHPLVVTPLNGDIVWTGQWSRARRLLVRRAIRKADLVTVDSNEMKLKTARYGKEESKMAYIAFGVDTQAFHPGARSPHLRKKLGIDGDAPIVLSSRSWGELYNIDTIIRAIPGVLAVLPKTVFLFSWYVAPLKDSLTKLAEDLGVMNNVRFLGKLDHGDLRFCYSESDVFVSVPSHDALPASLLEAMASGATPVISDLPSPRERVEDGQNGFVVPVRDVDATSQAIIRALNADDTTRRLFAQRNRDWVVQRADWNESMKRCESLYYGLAGKGL